MDKALKYYTKWHKPDTKGQVLYNSAYMKVLDKKNDKGPMK